MTRGAKIAAWVGGAIGGVLILALIGVLIVTQTRWGHRQVLRIALEQLDSATDGEIRIGRLGGNLLRGVRLIDVSIVDEEQRPFVVADTIETGFSLFGLLRQRIELRNVRLVHATVVLDQPPGEDWNFARIFRIEPEPEREPTPPGWGDYIVLRDVELVRTRVTVRSEWEPEDGLSPVQRERVIAEALSGETRANVQPVPGGFQTVMDFLDLHARFPRARVAHPADEPMEFEIGSLSGLLRPFLPPEAVVRDLSGRVTLSSDSLFFDEVEATFPGSRITGSGVYDLGKAKYALDLRGAPVALADIRWLYPPLPEEGGGRLRLRFETREFTTAIEAEEIDLRVGESALAGRLSMVVGDTLRFGETDLVMDRLDTRLVDRLIPNGELPLDGRITGRAALRGPTRALDLDADLAFADRAEGVSRVTAVGTLGMEDDLRFHDLFLRLDPLEVDLLRAEVPQLPLPPGGTIAGELRLDGATEDLLRLRGDLTHRHPRTGVSRVLADGALAVRDEVRFHNLLIRFEPLQAELVRPQLPQLPPGGTLAGFARLDGVPGGLLRVDGDVTLRDPVSGVSRVRAVGALDPSGDDVRLTDLRLRMDPLRTDLLRAEVPDLPPGAALVGDLRLDGSTATALRLNGDLELRDPATGTSRVTADGGLVVADGLGFRALRLQLHTLHLDIVRDRFPDLPPGVLVSGPLRLDGSPAADLAVDGALELRDPRAGVSRVAANGAVRLDEPLRFRGLDVRLDPLQVAFLRPFLPDLPIEGTLAGSATLDGAPAGRLAVRADLTHLERGERSRVVGRAELIQGERATADVQLLPLSLEVAGRFAPQAGLHGWAEGRLQATGTMDDLAIIADLRVPDDGQVAATGRLDLESEQPGYRLDSRLVSFNFAAVTRRAPATTSLTGTITADGRGTDPQTMRADLHADLGGPRWDGVEADTVRLRLAIDRGLARVDDSIVQLGNAEAWLDGTFGLVADRIGELAYRIEVDSLQTFAPYPPPGEPRRYRVPTEARPDTVPLDGHLEPADRVDRRTPGDPPVKRDPDREPAEPRDHRIAGPTETELDTTSADTLETTAPAVSLAGSLDAAGTLRGNIESFDLHGRAEVVDFAYDGVRIGSGHAEHEIVAFGTEQPSFVVAADLEELHLQGLDYDRATVRIDHRGARYGTGSAAVAVYQDEDTDLRADVEFDLALDRNELLLHEVDLRFDTITWRSAQPGSVRWNGDGFELASIDLRSDSGGRIFLDGALPRAGRAELQVVVEDLPLDLVVTLLQDDARATGVLSLTAEVQGSLASPELAGQAALIGASHDGREFPDTRAGFAYAGTRLVLDADFLDGGVVIGRAAGEVPIDLALADLDGPRLLDAPLALELRADGVPLEAIPVFTDAVSDVRGRIDGEISVGGTPDDPMLDGVVNLDLASLRLVASGVRYDDISGTLRFEGRTITVDSVVAWNGGPIRLIGELDLASLDSPVFDLQMTASAAQILDNEYGRLWVDAELDIQGPFDGVAIAGEARTHRGVFYLPEGGDPRMVNLDDPETFERLDPDLMAARDALIQPSPLLANLQVDLSLFVSPETWVRSTQANVEVYTEPQIGPLSLQYDGANGELSIEGTVNTDRGEYAFMGRRFQITRGAATFLGSGEFDPLIQVVAEHEVRMAGREPLEIRIVLQGTALEPTIALESNARPPLSQTDLLSFLAFGRTASSLMQVQGSSLSGQGAAAGDLVGNVAGLASQQLGAVAANAILQEFERDAARSLGLDVFHITPADLPAELFTGRFEDLLRGTRVEAGAYISPRVFAAGHARPTFETRPGARLEYRTPVGFDLVTSWEPRFLTPVPTLTEVTPGRTSVFGTFLRREWRF
jgi:translocation and assembly module TamB